MILPIGYVHEHQKIWNSKRTTVRSIYGCGERRVVCEVEPPKLLIRNMPEPTAPFHVVSGHLVQTAVHFVLDCHSTNTASHYNIFVRSSYPPDGIYVMIMDHERGC
jgi:hypothetical protein